MSYDIHQSRPTHSQRSNQQTSSAGPSGPIVVLGEGCREEFGDSDICGCCGMPIEEEMQRCPAMDDAPCDPVDPVILLATNSAVDTDETEGQ